MNNEKRAFDRVAFPVDRRIEVTLLSVQENKERIKARLLNISEGGIGLAFEKSEQLIIEKDKELVIDKISGDDALLSLQGQKVKIVWMLNTDMFANMGVGCEFISISDDCVECIRSLGKTETKVRQSDEVGR